MTTTILVIHTSRIQRVGVGGIFRDGLQWNVVYAANMAEAAEYLDQVPIDLVVAEPQQDGGRHAFDVIRDKAGDLPILALLETADHGVAVDALVAGASSYVTVDAEPAEIAATARKLVEVLRRQQRRPGLLGCMSHCETEFVVPNDRVLLDALVERLIAGLRLFGLNDSRDLFRVTLAINEALVNAADHGCLELDSRLRSLENDAYYQTAEQRLKTPPYSHRKIRVREILSPDEARIVIRDEGSGFDVRTILQAIDEAPDVQQFSGRGLLLIKTFMDEVQFNAAGNEITLIKRLRRPANSDLLRDCWDEHLVDEEADADELEVPSRLVGTSCVDAASPAPPASAPTASAIAAPVSEAPAPAVAASPVSASRNCSVELDRMLADVATDDALGTSGGAAAEVASVSASRQVLDALDNVLAQTDADLSAADQPRASSQPENAADGDRAAAVAASDAAGAGFWS